MSNNTEQLTDLIDKVRKLQERTTLWQSLPEDMTGPAADSIIVTEYFTQDELGDMLTPFQVDYVVDNLTTVLNFVKMTYNHM